MKILPKQLRVLHLEDEQDYSDYVREVLADSGLPVELVPASSRATFERECQNGTFALILADFSLPDYSGLDALEFVKRHCPSTPFILLSGTIGESAAVDSLRSGATDYVMKQWPERLVPAIRRAVEETKERIRHQLADAAIAKLGWLLNSTTTDLEAARIIFGIADELFPCDAFILALRDSITGLLHEVLGVDVVNGKRVMMPRDSSLPSLSATAKRVMVSGPELILRSESQTGLGGLTMFGDCSRPSESLMFVPLCSGGSVVGILSVQSYERDAYSASDLELFKILADHCGGALDRIQAQQRSRDLQNRFQELFDRSPDAIFVESEEGQVLDVNKAACELHSMTREELVGRHIRDLVPPACRTEVMSHFNSLVRGESSRVEGESWTRQGHVVPVEIRTGRIRYAGKPALLLHVRDISDRRKVESALRSSEQLFHAVWENSVDGMRLTDEHGRVVAVNSAFCELAKIPRADIEGKFFADMFSDQRDAALTAEDYVSQFAMRRIPPHWEGTVVFSDGRRAIIDQSNSFVELRGKPPMLLSVFCDVTNQRRLEEQFRQSQKMEAIGQLAGGVAHDFNNILTVISGHASMLSRFGALSESAAFSARQIVEASERAAGLTRQLLTFSRRQVMQPKTLDFNTVVRDITKLLHRVLGEHISLRVSYAPTPALVKADETMLEQVIMNLAVNARDAMPSGGELMLSVSAQRLSGEDCSADSQRRAGDFVCVEVSDTGEGISPDHLAHIFEPFFTTKSKTKGTGLGLATVYGVLQQHRGWVEVESVLQRGTTFRVYVPASEPCETQASPERSAPARGGNETILLVEDEQPVREMVSTLLSVQGYQVVSADSGIKALELWKDCSKRVDLLLTDLVMPGGMNGAQLGGILRGQHPGLKVIYMSGYSADVLGSAFEVPPGLDFLQKPFDPARLAKVVRESLDAAAA